MDQGGSKGMVHGKDWWNQSGVCVFCFLSAV